MIARGSTPRPPRLGVSARFDDRKAVNRATRALQKELKLPPENVSVAMSAGLDPTEATDTTGYIGITKGGTLIVHARAFDLESREKAIAILLRHGGDVMVGDQGSPSTGGYGPTTANGTRGVIGDLARTSSMDNHLYTYAVEPPKDPPPKT